MATKQTVPPKTADSQESPYMPMTMDQAHNKYFMEIFSNIAFAIAFLKFALKGTKILELLDLTKLTIEKRRFFDYRIFKESFADMIYRIPLLNKSKQSVRTFIVLEHKSYYFFLTIFQLAYYTMQIMLQDFRTYYRKNKTFRGYRLPLVVPIIFHHGKSKFTAPTKLSKLFPRIAGFSRYLFHFQAVLVDLNRIPLEELPNDPNVWQLNVVLKVMKLVFNGDQKEDIEACFQQIKPYLHDSPEP